MHANLQSLASAKCCSLLLKKTRMKFNAIFRYSFMEYRLSHRHDRIGCLET